MNMQQRPPLNTLPTHSIGAPPLMNLPPPGMGIPPPTTIMNAMPSMMGMPPGYPPPATPNLMIPPPSIMPPVVIRNDTPRISGPANNRIFVDGKAYEAPKQSKITILNVIDFILKNSKTLKNPKSHERVSNTFGQEYCEPIRTCEYRTHFAKNIVKLFEHVFVESDEKTREELCKLRTTWGNPLNIFSWEELYDIDIRINRAWPVQNPMPSSSNGATTTQFSLLSTPQVQTSSSGTTTTSNKVVHVNPKFFNKNETSKASKEEKRILPLGLVEEINRNASELLNVLNRDFETLPNVGHVDDSRSPFYIRVFNLAERIQKKISEVPDISFYKDLGSS